MHDSHLIFIRKGTLKFKRSPTLIFIDEQADLKLRQRQQTDQLIIVQIENYNIILLGDHKSDQRAHYTSHSVCCNSSYQSESSWERTCGPQSIIFSHGAEMTNSF
jgi:hypothetical protein